jgi:hypothetical protein
LIALVDPDVYPGPLHVVLDRAGAPVPAGSPVAVGEGELLVGPRRVDLRGTRAWWGALPPRALVRAAVPLLCAVLDEAAAGSSLPAIGLRASDGLERLGAGDLDGAAELLGGLGPGLTPAGDDALAGALFALRVVHGPAAEPALARIVEAVRTGHISLAFLTWGAWGQTLAPVHDLLAAAVEDDAEGAAAGARALIAVGASSGADFALGLRSMLMGLRSILRVESRSVGPMGVPVSFLPARSLLA